MIEILTMRLEETSLGTGDVSEWLSAEKDLACYRPLSSDRRGLFSFSAQGAGDLVAWSGSSSTERAFSVNLEGDDFMFFVEHGTHYELATGGIRHGVTPGVGLLTSADRYSALKIGAGSAAEGFCVPRSAVQAALASSFERLLPTGFEFAPLHDLNGGPAGHLFKLMRFFRDDMCGGQNLEVSPIALASFKEMFCLLMVQNLRHTLSDLNAPVRTIAPRQVRRALEFARAHAAMPITISDMAAAAGVSVRALQANFRRFLNATPMAYLRQLRLEGAHHDIVNAHPSATVAEIARRWGFMHLGRFSQEYRATFGVVPSADLARCYSQRRTRPL
ncbi:helix-turn-helix transcriptional regulator [Sinorhizobium saheli]|uniref:AraC family transcriptional regulator n=1 Tax=Sinorhizobium saheli TaxID=36856 RepID=A0A178Y7C3_SINSA|nr:helix-turn-helix transcriptional regulator [Sinorhizobium saheli]MQW85503.1 helix-turn-helix domain-containing protein [Sinorhizobium saheli]OAP43430.1 AraC family transcriptional regulator [Sinorhizobium saheli]